MSEKIDALNSGIVVLINLPLQTLNTLLTIREKIRNSKNQKSFDH